MTILDFILLHPAACIALFWLFLWTVYILSEPE